MRTLTLILALAATTPCQDLAPDGNRLLNRCCLTMSRLSAVAFGSVEEQDNALRRAIRANRPGGAGETEVEGGRAGDLRWASLDLEEDELLFRGDRSVARHEGGPWHPRRDKLVDGTAAPFVFDPTLFFDLLGRIPAERRGEVHQDATEWRETPVALVRLTLDGDDARDFVLGGALPPAGRGGSAFVIRMGMGGAPRMPAPDITLDLAVWIDPASGHALRVRTAAFQKNTGVAGANIQLRIGGANAGAVEEDREVEEFDADGERRIVGGLPVRKVQDGVSVVRFEVRLEDHGEASPPELDEAARVHLGLPAK